MKNLLTLLFFFPLLVSAQHPSDVVQTDVQGSVATVKFAYPLKYSDYPVSKVATYVSEIQRELGLPVVPRNIVTKWMRPMGWNSAGEPWFENPRGQAVHEEVATIWLGAPEDGGRPTRHVVELPYGVNDCTQRHAAMHIIANNQGYWQNHHPAFVYDRKGRELHVANLLGGDCWCPGVCTIDPALKFDFRPKTNVVTTASRKLGVIEEFVLRSGCPAALIEVAP